MRKLVIAGILLLVVVGCTQKKVALEPALTPETQKDITVGGQEIKPGPAPEEKGVVEAEKITELEIATAEKAKAETETIEKASARENELREKELAAEKYIVVVDSLCLGTPAEKVLFDSIYFDFDRYDIREDVRPTLKDFSSWLSQNDIKIYVEGHCDERGTNEYNLALGDSRATNTRDYLHSLGIRPKRIEVISCGEEAPVCAEQTEECWAKNRRAHFVILKAEN